MVELTILVGAGLIGLYRWRRSGQPLFDFTALGCTRLYTALWHRWSSNGPAPLPAKGPAILVVNHTCSADASFLMTKTPRVLSFLTSAEHYQTHPLVRRLLDYMGCVPVRRNGSDVAAARAALRRLREGRVLCIFPEGNLSGVARGRLHSPRHGAAFLALHTRAPVYPAYIAGGPRTHRLAASWVRPSPRAVRVLYGPAVDLSAYYDRLRDRRLLEEVTTLLMRRILELQPASQTNHSPRRQS